MSFFEELLLLSQILATVSQRLFIVTIFLFLIGQRSGARVVIGLFNCPITGVQ